MSARLTSAQVALYQASGILHPLPALDPGEADALAQRYLSHAAAIKGRNNQKPHLLYTWLDAVVRDARILDAVEIGARPRPAVLELAVLRQAGRRRGLRQLAPGRHLLGPVVARRDDGLGRADAEHGRVRLHAGRARHPPASR